MLRHLTLTLRRILLAASAMLPAACTTLGPDYQEPSVTSLDDWKTDTAQLTSLEDGEAPLDLRFWWHLFNDPVLNRLIDEARHNNPSLRIAGLRIYESRAILGIAGASRYPQLQQASGAISYVNTKGHNGATPLQREHFSAYRADLSVAWELDFWGRFQRSIESADAAFFASVSNQQDAQVLLSAQMADLYFAFRTAESRINIARRNAEIQKRSYDITEKRFKNGEDSELDLQQAKSQYLATLSSIPSLEITLGQTRNAISVLLGRAPGDILEITNSDYQLPLISPSGLVDMPASLLMRRPDIRAAAWQIAAQSAQIGIAEADYYPAITLLGTVGLSGNSLGDNPYTDSLGLGPAFTWNIFDYGRIANNIRVQDARLQQLIEQYQGLVLQAAREIDDAGYSVTKTAEQDLLINQSYEAADRALKIANTRYQEGYAGFQRVLDAQRALFTQSDRRLVNQGQHISAVINLYKALGGGWVEMSEDQLVPEETINTMKARSDWGELLDPPHIEETAEP